MGRLQEVSLCAALVVNSQYDGGSFAYTPAEPKAILADIDDDGQECLAGLPIYVCTTRGTENVFASLSSPTDVGRHVGIT